MTDLPGPYETITVEEPEPGIAVVRISRPEVRNAINTRMGHELVDAFTKIGISFRRWRAVIFTGEGDKAFCAGVDLKERKGMTDADWHAQHQLFERMMLSVLDCPVPVIAAVNGAAFAGGCEFVLLCDFAYAAKKSARFALTEVTIGIMPGGGGTQTLARKIGYGRAAEIIFAGTPFSAEEAFEWGMVNRLVPQEELMNEAMAAARRIAENAPLSVRQAKRAMLLGERMDLRTGMFFEVEAYNTLVHTEDRREGINAFNEKRKPVFRGH